MFECEIAKKYDSQNLTDEVIFMNDGYSDLDEFGYPTNNFNFELSENNKHWKYQANLYYKSLSFAGISKKNSKGVYLDLSCGRGGGVDFIKQNFSFDRHVGIDLTESQIEFCKSWCDAEFYVGSAIDIPLENNSVNVITTVEAASYYTPKTQYIKEAYRILKHGGLLIQTCPKYHNVDDYIEAGFKFKFFKNITENVRMSCSITKFRYKDLNDEVFYHLLSDEMRYINEVSLYNILIFQK